MFFFYLRRLSLDVVVINLPYKSLVVVDSEFLEEGFSNLQKIHLYIFSPTYAGKKDEMIRGKGKLCREEQSFPGILANV